MSSQILLSINLQGEIGGCVQSVDTQTVTVNATPQGSKTPLFITKKILHTDRIDTRCYRYLTIQPEVVESWESAESPYWANSQIWKKLTKKQRVAATIKRFDEGYGVSYSVIE